MSKKKQAKLKQQKSPAVKAPAAAGAASAAGPYLPVAHPPARNPTLLAVSAILFFVWFVYLLLAAVWG